MILFWFLVFGHVWASNHVAFIIGCYFEFECYFYCHGLWLLRMAKSVQYSMDSW